MSNKLLVALFAAVASLVASAPAEAQVHVQVGGTISVSGHVRVGPRRLHRIRRQRTIYVAPPTTTYYYFAEPPPPAPPPCGCECDNVCAPPAPVAAPVPVVTASAPYQRRMWLGLGLRGSSLTFGEDQQAESVGLIGRLRFRSVELELDIGKTRFEGSGREDLRVGGALIVPLTRGKWSPFLLVGAGVNQITYDDVEVERQGYLEGGGGLAVHLTRRLTLSGDVRWSSRKTIEEGDDYHLAVVGAEREERAVEGRLSAVLYF